MEFTVETVKGPFVFKNVQGLTVIKEAGTLALLNFNNEPIAQFNPTHIVAMYESIAGANTFVNDVPESKILVPGSLKIPGGR